MSSLRVGGGGGGGGAMGLFEFLEEAELQHHYLGLKNSLQVQNVSQLRSVVEDDLISIGMSKAEARRLRVLSAAAGGSCGRSDGGGSGGTYAARLKRLLLPKRGGGGGGGIGNTDDARQEFLLGGDEEPGGSSLLSSSASFRQLNRRHSSAGAYTSQQDSSSLTSHPLIAAMGIRPSTSSHSAIRVPSQQIIRPEAISVVKELGCGEFGVVQQGVWTDDNGQRHQVAVKCLAKERMQNNTLEFMKEYEIMQAIDHDNIVRLYGVVVSDASQILLITELAPLRSLLECLKELSLRSTFNVPCLADFAKQICEGMRYLEAKRLIHRDLAARNILVFSKCLVKISDFGLSRALGVGKDYYQTNYNANLKLPIAWCAPECINFLKFTSASDVWAFGVTLWEMFSYGFQPWAAQTGKQILDAIDEPNSQRLEQPLHCPRDYYAVMTMSWRHEVDQRPTFEQLSKILDDAKPEQVQAVANSTGGLDLGPNLPPSINPLDFLVGDVITVLSKENGGLWCGAHNVNGKVGYFSPASTVAYLGTLPSSQFGSHSKWQNEELHSSMGVGGHGGTLGGGSGGANSQFQRNSLRSSKGKKKLSRDMISGPRGDLHHTGHIGIDGAFFGDVGFIGSAKAQIMPQRGDGRKQSSSLMRADSDVSERAPLISSGRGGGRAAASKTGSCQAGDALTPPAASGGPTPHPSKPQLTSGANKNPRMGYTIGYLRKDRASEQQQQSSSSKTPHEYQSISDDEFGLGSLDLGPSLMDEVFSELDSSKDSAELEGRSKRASGGGAEKEKEKKSSLSDKRDLKDLVSSTLKLNKKQKQQATVKPIKASEERTLENAIAMANAIASKSMHDLDKRGLDEFDGQPPLPPHTPTSPAKKFNFWFPTAGGGERRHFSDEVNASGDLESILTPGAKDAYKALIEGASDTAPPGKMVDEPDMCHQQPKSPHSPPSEVQTPSRMSCPPGGRSSRGMSPPPPPKQSSEPPPSLGSNPLPLPPKSHRLQLAEPPKRHVRKNPLIIPSGMAANLLRREAVEDTEHFDLQVEKVAAPRIEKAPSNPLRSASSSSLNFQPGPQKNVTSDPRKETSPFSNPLSDAFENEIACSMDALDDIGRHESPMTSLPSCEGIPVPVAEEEDVADIEIDDKSEELSSLSGTTGKKKKKEDSVPLMQDEDDDERRSWRKVSRSSASGALAAGPAGRGLKSDEVRIMKKVLGMDLDPAVCVGALDVAEWNVHHAIKLIKVRNLVKAPALTDAEVKVALQTRDWDVAKAAGVLMKKLKE